MTRLPAAKLLLLSTLYFSQGLPFGFFTQALPVLLRERGLSLPAIGATSLLALPWALKFLWAPLVDRAPRAPFGRRRVVIVPLQLLAVALTFALAFVDPAHALTALLVAVLLANLVAATQDIATDGLAVETLAPAERGFGNGVQVAGYRVGMIVGGGALLLVFEHAGWPAAFLAMSGLLLVATLPIARHREAAPPADESIERVGWSHLVRFVRRPGMPAWLAVLVLYKAAEYLGTGMLRPFLVDQGLSLGDIGWLLGGLGFFGGLVGALLGGALVVPLGRARALLLFGVLQGASVIFYALPALDLLGAPGLWLAVGFEHVASGMATATLFTLMMDRCAPRTAGTDYTLQASVVVLATGAAAAVSGVAAEALGYALHFVVSGALCLATLVFIFLVLLPRSGPIDPEEHP